MKKDKNGSSDMLSEYDFTHAVRGKYAARFVRGAVVILLDPDVAKEFPTSTSVNSALRRVLKATAKLRLPKAKKLRTSPTPRSGSSRRKNAPAPPSSKKSRISVE